MAFDEVRPQTLQASSKSRHCCSLGTSLVATCQLAGTERKASRSWTRNPPSVWRRLRFDPVKAAAPRSRGCSFASRQSGRGPLRQTRAPQGRLRAGSRRSWLRGPRPRARSRRLSRRKRRHGPPRAPSGRRWRGRLRPPSAGVGVLDDHRRRHPGGKAQPVGPDELVHELPSGLGVKQVQIRHLVSAVLYSAAPTSHSGDPGRGSAQRGRAGSPRSEDRWRARTRGAASPASVATFFVAGGVLVHPCHDRRVVGSGMGKSRRANLRRVKLLTTPSRRSSSRTGA